MFELDWPWVFLAAPLPFFIRWLAPRAKEASLSALKIPFFKGLVSQLDIEEKKTKAWWAKSSSVLMLIWVLLLLALAGPRWVGRFEPIAREGHNIMLALDISGSMEMVDMAFKGRPASRLAVVKRAAENFVQNRHADKIGLILFGARAYLQTPLTYDHQNVLQRLEDASVGLAGNTTSIGDALGLAVKRLQQAPQKGRVVILLTDGVNNSGVLSPQKAAELARSEDIKVYTIGLRAQNQESLNPLFFNMNVAADLDEDTLRKIAKTTGGRYFLATNLSSLEKIYSAINQLEATDLGHETVRPQHEYYPWPLGFAFILFLYWLKQYFSSDAYG